MRGGVLRNLLTIQRRVQIGKTDLNEPNFVMQDWLVDVFCGVEVKRGREHFENKQRYSEEVWRFTLRYDDVTGIDASMKIIHEGMTFDIKALLPDGQRHNDIVIEATIQDSVLAGAALALNILDTISMGEVGETYSPFTVIASGGLGPYVLSVFSGALPAGLTMDAAGIVSGTPTVAGTTPVVFQAVDAASETARMPEIQITVT